MVMLTLSFSINAEAIMLVSGTPKRPNETFIEGKFLLMIVRPPLPREVAKTAV